LRGAADDGEKGPVSMLSVCLKPIFKLCGFRFDETDSSHFPKSATLQRKWTSFLPKNRFWRAYTKSGTFAIKFIEDTSLLWPLEEERNSCLS
jgi:hypothetical protein